MGFFIRGSHGPNYTNEFIDETIEKMLQAQLTVNIIVDCSHGNSNKDYRNQIKVATNIKQQIAIGQHNIKGIMLESNLVEGNQKCSTDKPMVYGQSITDSCINLDTTKEIFEIIN